MVSHGGRVILFAGSNTTSNRTWMWDGIVWQALMAGRENDVVF
ncbi:MAG: hypothetical protein SGI92_18340 [Bryobacteraceae bacterium]|nr:hypothetical protein [Bryobacteraceae bacterium]